MKSILVVFGNDLPEKSKAWWNRLDQVIAPSGLGEKVQVLRLSFVDIESLADDGDIKNAYDLVNDLSRLTLSDGSRLSKAVNWQGYELWWMNYGHLEHNFCLPYTQYRRLLEHLNNFDKVYIYQPHYAELFTYFLAAHHHQCVELQSFRARLRKRLLSAGILLQLVLSAAFLPLLMIRRPKVMYKIGDRIDLPFTCDFRHRNVHQELLERKVRFVEFVRSLQPWRTVLRNAWLRKRPVIYCTAITYFILDKLSFFESKKDKKLVESIRRSGKNSKETFWLLVATHYLKDKIRATQWSIRAMQRILQLIGVRSAIIISASSRALPEVLGCQLAGIKTVGIQHGLAFPFLLPHDFMPGYDGEKSLSIDRYGLWSEWWRDYYLERSRAYKPEQLHVSGHMRPLEKEATSQRTPLHNPLKVLYISEQLVDPKEELPYLLALLNAEGIALSLKLRPQLDEFEDWLKKNEPAVLGKVAITREDIHEAIAKFDVVVGSRSTAVLEGLCQLKPFVSFWTSRWGDYFEIRGFDKNNSFFAENPGELVEKARKSGEVPEQELKKLQERFFGDPHQNGAKWLIDQALKLSNETR